MQVTRESTRGMGGGLSHESKSLPIVERFLGEERPAVAARRNRVALLATSMLSALSVGDEVAILPAADAAPQQTLEIARVAFVNVHLVRLVDQRVYSLVDGSGLTPTGRGYIVPATEAHRAALAAARPKSAASDDATRCDS
jgi:hypothetical protein